MTMHCPLTGINMPRAAMTMAAAFFFIFAYDFVVHGMLLAGQYEATQNIWRPKETMGEFMPWCMLTQALTAVLVTMLYAVFVNCACMKKNIKFGLILGLIFGVSSFGMYPYLPIPMSLALIWLISGIVTGLGLGVICGLIYKDTKNKCCDVR